MMRKRKGLYVIAIVATLALWVAAASACTTIIVGKERSATGNVLVAHNEELGWNAAQHLVAVGRKNHAPGDSYKKYSGGRIPQPPETWRYIASKVFDKEYYPGDYTTGVNEWGVTVANNMSWTKEVPEETAWDTIEGGVIWTEFTQLVLERAKTAREGVELMGELCETMHLSGDPGTMFAIADPEEGWWIEIARDGQWIAVLVGDDEASMRANGYRIGPVDLDDENVLHSPGIVDHALEKGWYDPAQGPFDFSKAYGDPWCFDDYNTLRHKLVEGRLEKLPKVSREDLMEILRWNYEGTLYYQYSLETGSPWVTEHRTISRLNTEISSVAELRPDMAQEGGHIMWWCMNTPKTGVFIPWYLGTREFPAEYSTGTDHFSTDSAYWTFYELKMLAHQHYRDAFPLIEEAWSSFEKGIAASRGEMEGKALDLYKTRGKEGAEKLLTEYSNELASEAFTKAKELIAEIKTVAWFQD
ncbi:MAG: dipeptidase [Thermovirgaceae bacterium]